MHHHEQNSWTPIYGSLGLHHSTLVTFKLLLKPWPPRSPSPCTASSVQYSKWKAKSGWWWNKRILAYHNYKSMILLSWSQTPAYMVSSTLPIDKKILKNNNGYLNLNHALIYLEEKLVLYPSDIRSHNLTYLAKIICFIFREIIGGHDLRNGIWNDPICRVIPSVNSTAAYISRWKITKLKTECILTSNTNVKWEKMVAASVNSFNFIWNLLTILSPVVDKHGLANISAVLFCVHLQKMMLCMMYIYIYFLKLNGRFTEPQLFEIESRVKTIQVKQFYD